MVYTSSERKIAELTTIADGVSLDEILKNLQEATALLRRDFKHHPHDHYEVNCERIEAKTRAYETIINAYNKLAEQVVAGISDEDKKKISALENELAAYRMIMQSV